jgi:hypothetical protein
MTKFCELIGKINIICLMIRRSMVHVSFNVISLFLCGMEYGDRCVFSSRSCPWNWLQIFFTELYIKELSASEQKKKDGYIFSKIYKLEHEEKGAQRMEKVVR